MIKTYNFNIEPSNSAESCRIGEYRDFRNGFVCVNPTLNLECYINYIRLLNLFRDNWKSNGYLDLGMMPLVMGPSFMQAALTEVLVPAANSLQIPCYSMPPVSLMHSACNLADNDIWLFKDDVAECTGIPVNKLTLEALIRWCKK